MPSRVCLPLVLTVLVWGYNFVALKIVYFEVSPAAAALMRHVLMYFILVAVCRWWLSASFPEFRTANWLWGGWRIGLFGILSMGIYMVLFLEAVAKTSAAEGAILIATAPLFTTLFAVIAKQEMFSSRVLVGALVAFAGVAMVVFAGDELRFDHLLGNGLMLASAIGWALGAVVSRPLVRERPAILVLTQSMPAALVVLVPYALSATLATPWLSLSPPSYFALAHFTALAGALGFVGFFYGVQKIGAPGAMYYQFCVAPVATLFAWIFLGDSLGAWQIVGMGIVLFGVILATAARNREASKHEVTPLDCPAEA